MTLKERVIAYWWLWADASLAKQIISDYLDDRGYDIEHDYDYIQKAINDLRAWRNRNKK